MGKLYAILDLGYVPLPAALGVTGQLLAGGIDLLQIRAKHHPPEVIAALAREIHPLTSAAGIPLILNDHPALLLDVPAEGVHVGQDDLPVSEARRTAGRPCLVGKSTHSVEQAAAAVREGADYIGFGPLFATATKPDYTPVGLTDLRTVHAGATIPVYCIGGIQPANLDRVLAAGAVNVVIVSALLQATDITGTVRAVKAKLGAHVAQ